MESYKKTTEEIFSELDTKKSGLTDEAIEQKRKKYGSNRLDNHKKINPFTLFFSQFKDILIIILIIAASISLIMELTAGHGSVTEPLLIFGIVIAIAFVGFFNEYKAEKTVEALSKLVALSAHVRRNGKVIEINSDELVPGDIVLIDAGQKIPADIRITEAEDILVNEASLTGESVPVAKNTNVIKSTAVLGDQKNMLFSGTLTTNGRCEGVVIATGSNTEIGKIAGLVEGVDTEPTPMQHKLNALGKRISILVGFICLIVFVLIFFLAPEARSDEVLPRLVFALTGAVALAVAAIPEGLAFVVRISLALGARRMAAQNALVRKLSAVEALGSTDVICTDKTGTLTKGEMKVRKLFVNMTDKYTSSPSLRSLLTVGVLCNDANLDGDKMIGDPTEACLLVSAAENGIDHEKMRRDFQLFGENPFSSDRKMMSTAHLTPGGKYLISVKGAPENILEHCTLYQDEYGKTRPLTDEIKNTIKETNAAWSRQALRVLGFAAKTVSEKPEKPTYESDLIFIGLQGMMDPPRKEVSETIKRVQEESGMRVIMITGDYIETAKAIAKEIGIKGEAMSGVEIDTLSQSELENKVETIGVFARVNPEHKIRIVQALKKHGHQVAMTGDGVNDAPAIKAADIGIAMGITGTDVSKEAAGLILLDDKFITIIKAIEEGRGIFENVRKFVSFLISCNVAEVVFIAAGLIIFNDLLLTAAQILFINIVTDGLPAVALGSDPARKDILKSKPKEFQGNIITGRMWAEVVIFAVTVAALLLGHFWLDTNHESSLIAGSAIFVAIIVYEMVRLIDIRTDYKIRWLANPWLTVAIASSVLLQLAVVYIPPLANFFALSPIGTLDWAIIVAGSIVIFVIMKIFNLDAKKHQLA